jgi:RNA polymerase subunit RPABC4/transcription elongation factor Spt4
MRRIAFGLAAIALLAATPAGAQSGSGWLVIQGTRVYSQADMARGIATFSNECGTQTLTHAQLGAGAIPNQIIPCPRPEAGGGNRSSGGTCPPGRHPEGGGCVPDGQMLCPDHFHTCKFGQTCGSHGCLDIGETECGPFVCDMGQVCARDGCVPLASERVCANRHICDAGQRCGSNNTCESAAAWQQRSGACTLATMNATIGHIFDANVDEAAKRAEGARAEIKALEAARPGCAEFPDQIAKLNEALAKARKKLDDALVDEVKEKKAAHEKAQRLVACKAQADAARRAVLTVPADKPDSKAKAALAKRLEDLVNDKGACAEFMDEETCPTCVAPTLQRMWDDLQAQIKRDKAIEAKIQDIDATIDKSDRKGADAAKQFPGNDPRATPKDPFGNAVEAQKSDHKADVAGRDLAQNDPRAGGNVFQNDQRAHQAQCGSDINIDGNTQRPAGCRNATGASSAFTYRPRIPPDVLNKAQAGCPGSANDAPCVLQALANLLIAVEPVLRELCGTAANDHDRIVCLAQIMKNGVDLLPSQCPGGDCSKLVGIDPVVQKAIQLVKLHKNKMVQEMQNTGTAEELIKALRVLKAQAEQMAPDDPRRAAIIAELQDALGRYGIDVNAYFRRFDELNAVARERQGEDPFVKYDREAEERERQAKDKARLSLTDAEEKYCRDLFLRVNAGERISGAVLAHVPQGLALEPGGFMTACRGELAEMKSAGPPVMTPEMDRELDDFFKTLDRRAILDTTPRERTIFDQVHDRYEELRARGQVGDRR